VLEVDTVMLRSAAFALAAGVLLACPGLGRAQDSLTEKPVILSIGAGWTAPVSDGRDHLADGWNFNFGAQFNVTRVIGIEALYGFNGFGDKRLSLPVFATPLGSVGGIPTDFFGRLNMHYGTGNLIIQKPEGPIRPYGLVGAGVYYRPIQITTPAVGWVPGYCDPYWYVCYPGGFVPTDRIVGERSSTDFGMDFGGGIHFGQVFAELRYHHIWGPTIQGPADDNGVSTEVKANGKFVVTTFGVRF
jgi:hypothetical protein